MSIQVKVFPPKPTGFECLLDELYSMQWPDGEPCIFQISDSTVSRVFGFLKDAQARFKVLHEDGAAREWSPGRRDWMESAWDD